MKNFIFFCGEMTREEQTLAAKEKLTGFKVKFFTMGMTDYCKSCRISFLEMIEIWLEETLHNIS